MIRTTSLQKLHRTEEVETTALDNVSLEIREGEFVAVMGPSGSGKTTFLNILGLLDRPTAGKYHLLDQEVSNLGERQLSAIRKSNIGFVFQSFNLIDEQTVFENVELPLLYLRLPRAERKSRVDELLDRFGIRPRRDHFPPQLSGGQQQRVAVARAVVADPRLILADEPTGNLDSAHGEEVMGMLTKANEGGTTVVMVTHSRTYADYADRVIHLFDGKVVSENLASVDHV
jgi:putative ABC transport system ATP-binding protein